jgi:ferredoxin
MFIRAGLSNVAWKCDLCGDCIAVCGTNVLRLGAIETAAAGGAQ